MRIKGDGTPEQFREIHETVIKTSPNYFNITRPIAIDAELRVEKPPGSAVQFVEQ
ncbi:MAG TPA: hypothetical protein VEU51_17080 [Candidatus Acidoferrales bacterium]|nr:hypothetical protein [Candidatus Acidoferrales bacterium]